METAVKIGDLTVDLEAEQPLCRCCLSTENRMLDATKVGHYFKDLANIDVVSSDGLPSWICHECEALLRKAVMFKQKMLRVHTMLCDYITRCSPFPIEAGDPELARLASPQLCATRTLAFDTEKAELGFHEILKHNKQDEQSELRPLCLVEDVQDEAEVEMEYMEPGTDYEGDIPLYEISEGPEGFLANIRLERQKANKQYGALEEEARRELVSRKRQAQLERMLLPDAPARKRTTKNTSPERSACVIAQSVRLSASAIERRSRSRSPVPHVGAELVVASSSKTPAVDDDSDNFESVEGEWLTLTRDACVDSDDEDVDLNELTADAAIELAYVTDLTAFQANVLQVQDDANDRAVRDMITDDDSYTFNWSYDRATFTGTRETFAETSGPTIKVTKKTQPIDIFDEMFDVEFIDLLVTETNRYALQKIASLTEQNKLATYSRLKQWTPTDRDEMVTFLSIQILQGLFPLPEEEAYFAFNGFGTMPYFARIMSYRRFRLLKKMLHFVDSQTLTDTTKLCKIRPVVDYFNDKFSRLYMPAQEIAIDESLLKLSGRLSFAQKIATKAARVGVKTYELCESSTGYLWKFIVYTGKDKQTNDSDGTTQPDDDVTENNNDRPTNATAKIVLELIEPLLNRGHTLIMDNFYNTPLLLRYLKNKQTDCYGTLRLNREFVPDSMKTLTKTELRHGEVVASYCTDLSVMVWRDANLVSMISTYHSLEVAPRDKYNRVTYKPTVVLDYNKTMGGIDRKDQFLSAQPLERVRNKIWYKKLFRRLFNAALFNCFVIYSRAHAKVSHRKFRTVLAEELLKRHRKLDLTKEPRLLNTRNSSGEVKTSTVKRARFKTQARPHIEHNHFPIKTGSMYTCCAICVKKTRTSWKCEECDVKLCIIGCFKAWHKKT